MASYMAVVVARMADAQVPPFEFTRMVAAVRVLVISGLHPSTPGRITQIWIRRAVCSGLSRRNMATNSVGRI
jgi:hypothetical protein